MNSALDIRTFLQDRTVIFNGLRERQQKINAPTFSCKHAVEKTLEDPRDAAHMYALILQKMEQDKETNTERLFGNVELLKCGIRILNLQNDLALRRGANADTITSEVEKMDFLLAFAQAERERAAALNPFDADGDSALSSFFNIATERLNNTRMGIEIPDITDMDEAGLEEELHLSRRVFAAHITKQIDLNLAEIFYTQNMTLQLERGIVKKFIPDSSEVREQVQGYRTGCNKILKQTGEDLAALERFEANLGADLLPGFMRNAGVVIVPLPLPQKYSLAMPRGFMP